VANGKIELGVVDFHDSFESYDQFTRLGAAYSSPSNRASNQVTFDSTISSDYRGAPFYMHETLSFGGGGSTIRGTEFFVGPSTNASFEGAVDRSVVSTFDGTNKYQVNMPTSSTSSLIGPLFSAFAINDPVTIRTVPLGWVPAGTFSSLAYGVCPIARVDELYSYSQMATIETVGGLDMDDSQNLKNVQRYGVRLMSDNTGSDNTSRYIYINTPVNSISPSVRRWRTSWLYRISRANPGSANTATGLSANIKLKALSADGNVLADLTGESSGTSTTGTMANYTTTVDAWTKASALFSMYGSADTGNAWNILPNDALGARAATRLNRLQVQIGLYRGVNTAFDVDDLVIEHAHGTTQEANGYYEIQDFPTDGLQWRVVGDTSTSHRGSDGRLKVSNVSSDKKIRFGLTARFDVVDTSTYLDIVTLISYHKNRRLIALHPYHPLLPQVMVGKVSVTEFDNTMWDLQRCSFTLNFEEA